MSVVCRYVLRIAEVPMVQASRTQFVKKPAPSLAALCDCCTLSFVSLGTP
jgi:hypothetical protein